MNPDTADTDRLAGINLARLERFRKAEVDRFLARYPSSRALHEAMQAHWLNGVPDSAMMAWPGPFPLAVARARKARLTCADGHRIDDFSLGGGAALFGHAPKALCALLPGQQGRNLATGLPDEHAPLAGQLLDLQFGARRWQMASGPEAALEAVLNLACAATGRDRVVVVDGAEGGCQDLAGGIAAQNVGVPFNDLQALERALAGGGVAAVLTEPALSGAGLVPPAPGYLEGVQMLAADHGALFLLDETQTLFAGPGPMANVLGLAPDALILGEAVLGGVPGAVWGLTSAVVDRLIGSAPLAVQTSQSAGFAGSPASVSGLQIAGLIATLSTRLTPRRAARMQRNAAFLAAGLDELVRRYSLPWQVVRLGARVDLWCDPADAPRNGAQALAARQPRIEGVLQLGLLNRGVLIGPGPCSILVGAPTRRRQIDRMLTALDGVLADLTGEVAAVPAECDHGTIHPV